MSQLAYLVSKIVQYFSKRASARRRKWKERYEGGLRDLNLQKNHHTSLKDEVEFLQLLYHREELVAEVWNLAGCLLSLILFWLAGAAIFSNIQPGWTYGDALYFQVVFCLTIG